MREEAASADVDVRKAKELDHLRHKIERQLANLEELLRDHRPIFHKKDIFEVEQALKRGRMALLKSNDKAKLSELLSYIARFHSHLSQKLDVDV